ncbi:MAG: ATP-binding cassette domain-containing protein [Actinomycetes bacterium]
MADDSVASLPASGLDKAVRTLTSPDGTDVLSAPHLADQMHDALSLIGEALDEPSLSRTGGGADDTLEAAIATSGLMAWRVRLTGRWFTMVPVPLLVRTDTGPALVVPNEHGVLMVDAGTRRSRRLTSRHAVRVDADALAFAVDLPTSSRWPALIAWSLRRRRRDLWAFVLLAAVTGFGALLLPITTAAVFEVALPLGRPDLAIALLVAFGLASTALALLALQRGYVVVRIRDRMDVTLSAGVISRLLRLKAGFFRSRTVGDVANRALAVDRARAAVEDSVVSLLAASVFGLVSIGYLFAAGATIGFITAGVVVIVLAASIAIQLRARERLTPLLEHRSQTDAFLLSLLENIVSWRATGAEDRALARWARAQSASTRAMRVRLRALSLSWTVERIAPTAVLTAFVVAVAVVPVAALTPGDPAAPGVFLAMYAAVAQVMIATLALSSNLLTLSEYGPQLARLEPILTSPTERDLASARSGLLNGAFSLRDVQFGYRSDRPPLFTGMSFDVSPGEFVAVVGPSGSGKSTLLRLMLGFEHPWAGTVSYGGTDLAQVDPTTVRRQMGAVLQGAHPLGTTIRESICGPRSLTDDELHLLLSRSGLAEDVAAMPRGLDTSVGSGGADLSGGQRQRIMLAAALAGNPAILLLDEATSALDNLTQSIVMKSIIESKATRFVIAHRLSTVRHADRVLVIAGGAIAESGTPDELLAAGGLFAQLAARQEI